MNPDTLTDSETSVHIHNKDERPGLRQVVAVALALWFGLVFLLGNSSGGVFCRLLRMERIPGIHPRRRPPACDRNSSVAMGWPGLPLALCIWCSAWTLRFPGWTRRYGDRVQRT